MVYNISHIVRQFQHHWTKQLEDEAIEQACRDQGLRWKNTLLNPITTIKIFFLQILHGNTAMTHLRHLTQLNFTASAYCQARLKLPLAVFQKLCAQVSGALQGDLTTSARWLGHRLFYVDGSSFSMPDTPALQEYFGQPGEQQPGCGFPVAHFLALMHAGTGLFTQVLAAPLRTHDLPQMVTLHPELQAGDVLAGDRAFCSFAHVALLCQRGVHAVMRIHQRRIVDFTATRPAVIAGHRLTPNSKGQPRSRWVKALDFEDQVVEWYKPKKPPHWMSKEQYAQLPERLTVRELRYRIENPGFRTRQITLVTTLLDAPLYPAHELAGVYARRWTIETSLYHLKITLKMDVLKCETVDGVLKELAVFLLIYNLVRMVMIEAAQRQQVDINRVSFVDALRWLMHANPGDELVKLVVNPRRSTRYEPRVRKRRPKKYKLMNQPRTILKMKLAA